MKRAKRQAETGAIPHVGKDREGGKDTPSRKALAEKRALQEGDAGDEKKAEQKRGKKRQKCSEEPLRSSSEKRKRTPQVYDQVGKKIKKTAMKRKSASRDRGKGKIKMREGGKI